MTPAEERQERSAGDSERRVGSRLTLHIHDCLQTVTLNEEIVLVLLLLPFTDDGSVDGGDSLMSVRRRRRSARTTKRGRETRTNLDDDVGQLSLDVPESEVSTLLVVDVDSDSVVVRDDVNFLWGEETKGDQG